MSLHNLKPAEGSTKTRKRVGRGQGSGSGGTAGKGHKGAKSRSGYKSKRGFEGGQMPLQRRTPKRGFNNPFKEIYQVINLSKLQELAEKHNIVDFNFEQLRKLRIISKSEKLKVLANGELKSTISISAHAFSDKAKEAIEKLGGKTTVI
ncbi:MAG: 50S ribosomal protein L15 [Sphingobacteriales bacterium]|nr:MAG: 50S ribosomal protein L15 [Sphingobacteriales bacterium]